MRLLNKLLPLVLALCLVFSSTAAVTAAAQSELEKAENSYVAAKKQYDKLKDQKVSAEEKLVAAQNAYYALVAQVEALNKNIASVQAQINKLDREIKAYTVKINKQQALLNKKYREFCGRLKAIYISGSMSSLQVLFTCEDFSDYLTRLEMITKVGEKDAIAIEELEDLLHELQAMQRQLDADRGAQEAKKTELNERKNELDVKKSEAASSLAECESIISEIKAAQADAQKEMKEALAQINKLAASGGIKGSGQLCYPVPSCTTVSCGFYGYSGHNGVDFASGPGLYGAPVVASDDGQVVGADMWEYSYGHHVTIDHGNGMKTIYCHMSNISVSVGQNVKKGQIIGGVGCTGHVIPSGMGGTHLHFGVIVNGAFVNPFSYL